MAAFKNHCSFGFWKGVVMTDPHKVMSIVGKTSMGSFDRINEMKDLPADMILLQYIKEAVKLNEDDVKLPARSKPKDTKPASPKIGSGPVRTCWKIECKGRPRNGQLVYGRLIV